MVKSMRDGTRNTSSQGLVRSRKLRTDASASEKVMWECLRKKRLGFRFNRQVPVGPYVLDFYCAEASLVIEIDGEQHAGRRDADERRDEWLRSRSVETLRIPSLDLFEETGIVATRWLHLIAEICERRSGRPAFPE
jgi:very-short-patch-repair endonuclease